MHPNIAALMKALGGKAAGCRPISGFPDSLVVDELVFVYAATPFNSESTAAVCRDKSAAHAMLLGSVPMPETRAFIDPSGSRAHLAKAKSISEIIAQTSDMSYPRMIKMNSGERGKNVFFVENDSEAHLALEHIYNRKSRRYDFIALVQEHIDAVAEWRVAISAGRPVFAYSKGEFALAASDKFLALAVLAKKAAEGLGLSWGAIDILESKEGALYFIEANSRPGYEGFIKRHGDEVIADLYSRALANHHRAAEIKNEGALQLSHSIDSTASSR